MLDPNTECKYGNRVEKLTLVFKWYYNGTISYLKLIIVQFYKQAVQISICFKENNVK